MASFIKNFTITTSFSFVLLFVSFEKSYAFNTFEHKATFGSSTISWQAKLLGDDGTSTSSQASFNIERCSWPNISGGPGRHARDISYTLKKWNDVYGMFDRFREAPRDEDCVVTEIDHTDNRNSISLIYSLEREVFSAQVRVVDTEGLYYGKDGLSLRDGTSGNIRNVDVMVPLTSTPLWEVGWKNCTNFYKERPEQYLTFRSMIFHELGHALGLAHTCENHMSSMRSAAVCNPIDDFPTFCSIDNVRAFYDDADAGRTLYGTSTPSNSYVESSIGTYPFSIVFEDIIGDGFSPDFIDYVPNYQINDTTPLSIQRIFISAKNSSETKNICPGGTISVEVSTQNLGNVAVRYDRNIFMAPEDLPKKHGQSYDNYTVLADFQNRIKSPNVYQFEDVEEVQVPHNTPPGNYVFGTHIYNTHDPDININDNIAHNLNSIRVLDSSHPACPDSN